MGTLGEFWLPIFCIACILAMSENPATSKMTCECPEKIVAYHVTDRKNLPTIFKDGFIPGNKPGRCRIGRGIYFLAKKNRAKRYAERSRTKGKNGQDPVILTCVLFTKGKIAYEPSQ